MALGPKIWPGSYGLRDQITSLDNSVTNLNDQVASIDGDISDLTNQVVYLDGYTSNLSNQVAYLDGYVSNLDTRTNILELNSPTSDQKAALVGSFGTPSATNRYVTEEDVQLERYHTITVSPVGTYTSVKSAIDSITASELDQYAIYVAPGVYFEQPFNMKPYVSVIGKGGHGHSVILATLDDYNNFITGSEYSGLTDVDIIGPVGNGCSAILYEDLGSVPFRIDNCIILDGYYGITCNTISGNLQITDISTSNIHHMNTFLRLNSGSVLATNCVVSGTSVCNNGFTIVGANSTLYLTDSIYEAGGRNGVFIDDGAFAVLNSCAFTAGTYGVHIGPTGLNTEIYIGSCFFLEEEFTWNLLADTNTCIVSVSGGFIRRDLISIPEGTRFVASFVDDNHTADSGNVVRGELWCGPIAATIPLVSYTKANGNTGVVIGGEVTRVSGLTVNISDGYGFINNGQIIERVSWPSTNLTLDPNMSTAFIICDIDAVFSASSFVTSPYNSISFAVAATDATNVTILGSRCALLEQPTPSSFIYARDVVGPISVSGTAATKHSSPSLQMDVDAGSFYIYNIPKTADAHAPITFTYWNRNVSGGWTATLGQTAINPDGYDAYNYTGAGTVQPVPSGKFKRDLLYLTTNGAGTEYHIVYGQQIFDSANAAISNPNPPTSFNNIALRLAGIVVQQGASDIATVADQRPRLGQLAAAGTTITDHGSLTGLADNDHLQYQLRSEKNLANGFCGLNANTQVATAQLPFTSTPPVPVTKSLAVTGTLNEIAKSDHKHDISTASPAALSVGNTANEGVATSLARSDHQHAVSAGAPVSVSTANAIGSAATFSHSDHVHAVPTDVPVNVDLANAAGSASTFSKSDHVHAVPVATPVSVSIANASGSASTFSRSDHVHAGLTRGAADFTTFTQKTTPLAADTLLIEDSASGQAKAYATLGNVISVLDPFGRDFTNGASEGASTTNNAAFQTKLTVTTGALTGVYRVGCHAELTVTVGGPGSRDVSARLYNSTDATELCAVRVRLTTLNTDVQGFNGFQFVTFTGAAKTFLIQYASPSGATVSISRARIEIWRVS